MEGKHVAVAAILVIFAGVVLAMVTTGGEDTAYGLEFDLGGGYADVPDSYVSGDYLEFPVPERDGYRFEGWYSDPGFTVPFPAILETDTGDRTAYARWSDSDLAGEVFSYDLVQEVDGKDREGSYEIFYAALVDSVYYVENRYVLPDYRIDTVGGHWSDEEAADGTYVGNDRCLGFLCERWDYGDGTQWIHRGIIMKSEQDGLTVTLSGNSQRETVADVSIRLVQDSRLEVSGDLTVPIGSEVVLTAEGDCFAWWETGGKACTDRTISFERADPFISLELRGYGYTVLDTDVFDPVALGHSGDITVADYHMQTISKGDSPLALKPGQYHIIEKTDDRTLVSPYFLEDRRVFSHSWTFGGQSFSAEIPLELSRVNLDCHMQGSDIRYFNPLLSVLADPSGEYVSDLAAILKELGRDMDERTFAEFVLRMVQELDYLDDWEQHGASEFFQFPGETMWYGGGDCEDTSVLYAALMSALGYRSCILVLDDHVMAGVSFGDIREGDAYVERDGVRYAMAETTNTVGYWIAVGGHGPSDVRYIQPVE